MATQPQSRLGVLGGIAGVVIGGFTWVVIYGAHVGRPGIAVAGIASALAVWLAARAVHGRFPSRLQALLGGAILVVCALDWLYVGLLGPSLPEHSANPAIGISRDALRVVQPILIAGSIAGTALILWDLLHRKP